ncbi:transmembrane protein 209 isoform X2 [Olea europaea var. sylvestris]|uniref:transmembrane protein 209 isoform X2 n=1 Tax=Olea europaea var. sylvestris TaxID=158386 RepID=UPI000C1D7F52|nr:transmembrane protein 209 isoform X2 [Olea europaea var. sylvestris]
MDGGEQQSSNPAKPSKFAVYQNAALSAALTSNSLRPSASTFLFILSLFSASSIALLISISRENAIVMKLGLGYVSQEVARLFSKVIQTTAAFIIIGSFLTFVKAITQWRPRNDTDITVISPSKGTKEKKCLTSRQLGLLGLSPKADTPSTESSRKPPKSRTSSPSPSNVLVPLHQPITGSTPPPSRMNSNKSSTNGGRNIRSFSSPSKSPVSPSLYLVPAPSSRSPSVQNSPGSDQYVATPWSNKRPAFHKEITTEEELEYFLADVDEKITETASKLATPPPTVNGFGVSSPNAITGAVNTSGTTRSTPLRPVRMSPGSQKFTTPPKKGEGDLPPPMSMEESIEAFQQLGIYPYIEQWRDRLRQWFSSVLLNPLLSKIDTSHIKVMDAAAKLGITITISQVGSDTPPTTVSPIERTGEWPPAIAVDEDGLLHQLRATLVQALDTCMPKLPLSNFQQSVQQNAFIPILQEGIDAITEHQRLHALMKGECVKGLLPQSSVRADYTVQRIRELAEGTCLKNYEYLGSGEVYDKLNKKWTFELPSDSCLLLYLFCAFLEYPNWMLHVDPTAYAGAQSSKNPLFLGILPPKERYPEKYIAIVSGVPSVLHPGACTLSVGKQSPPVFALYWDKKPQFSLQGRTALWDSILLLCYKIKISYGGIVRGMHLGSSALAILPVLDQETEE